MAQNRDKRRNESGANDDLDERVVFVNRCAKTVKGGRRMSFSAVVVVGDHEGKVGVGFGKANEVSDAIRLEAVGIRDAVGKSLGSKNRLNVVKATLDALSQLRSAEEIAALRA